MDFWINRTELAEGHLTGFILSVKEKRSVLLRNGEIVEVFLVNIRVILSQQAKKSSYIN